VTRVHAFDDDALGDRDAVGLVDAIADGEVSIPDVVEAAIARTERLQPELNAVAYVAYDRARREARDPRPGYFAGVPTFLKDNVAVAGMPTQEGCDAFQARPSAADGDLARMLLATGLVPLGKTQLSEFGFGPAAEHPRLGAVRCPWDAARTAGASSAGAGALVAAGAVPLAHGNDGGGSIRIPASVNGLVGLKPTRGRLAQDRITRQLPVRIVSDGVLTRSVRDTAAFLRESERVYRALRLPPVGDVTRPGRRRLRIAVHTQGLGATTDPEVVDLTLQTARLLDELGHHVEEVPHPGPPGRAEDFLLYWSFLAQLVVGSGRATYGRSWSPERLDNLTLGLARHCRSRLHRVPGAITRLRRTAAVSAEFHRTFDVALSPTLALPTPPVGHHDPTLDFDSVIERILAWVSFTPWQNATGDPAVSLPLATTSAGLPQGMMLAAGAGRESTLLELAYELEEAAPWPRLGA